MRVAALCIGAMLLQGPTLFAQNSVPQWQNELTQLDNQIQELSLKIDSSRHKSLDAETNAQKVMMSDFTKYTNLIKEAEFYEEQSRTTQAQLKLLLDQRKALIQSHSGSTNPAQ